MMITTAGDHGPLNSFPFGDSRKPLSPATWMAIGIVGLSHAGIGALLYYQTFELPPPVQLDPAPKPFEIVLARPKPLEPVVADEPEPANPPIHRPDTVRPTPEPLQAVFADKPVMETGPVITLGHLVTDSAPDAIKPLPKAAESPAPVISSPQWIRQPSGDQLMRAYPQRALRDGTAGAVSMICQVQTTGTVRDCAITGETPGNYGFGRAAQSLSQYFRISPRTVDGRAVGGTQVSINLRFTLPED